MAKRHFRHYIEAESDDPRVNRWGPFIKELQEVFGDPNCLTRALDKILELKMADNHHNHCCMVQFKEAADKLGWADDDFTNEQWTYVDFHVLILENS
jgi:hypothetical protein